MVNHRQIGGDDRISSVTQASPQRESGFSLAVFSSMFRFLGAMLRNLFGFTMGQNERIKSTPSVVDPTRQSVPSHSLSRPCNERIENTPSVLIQSLFRPYNEDTEEGFQLTSEQGWAHLCNVGGATSIGQTCGVKSIGHTCLVLEFIENGQYTAKKAEIFAYVEGVHWLMGAFRSVASFRTCVRLQEKKIPNRGQFIAQQQQKIRKDFFQKADCKPITESESFSLSTCQAQAVVREIKQQRLDLAKALVFLSLELGNDPEFMKESTSEGRQGVVEKFKAQGLLVSARCEQPTYLECMQLLKSKFDDTAVDSESKNECARKFFEVFSSSTTKFMKPFLLKHKNKSQHSVDVLGFRVSGPTIFPLFDWKGDRAGPHNCTSWARSLLHKAGVDIHSLHTNKPKFLGSSLGQSSF